jgi:hypothetical protein
VDRSPITTAWEYFRTELPVLQEAMHPKGIDLQATQRLMGVSYVTNTAAAADRTDAVPFSSSISSKPLPRMYRVKAMTALDAENGKLAHHVLPFWFHV